jgi:predicted enzyme related to lactoylglutathione lyase
MSEMQSYPQGAPSWADLGARDVDAARDFYARVFGWEYARGPEDAGFYSMCQVRGLPAAGIYPQGEAQREHGVPPTWTIYFAVEDADRFAEAVEEAGGRVLIGPMQVMQQGRALLAHDRSGAVFGAWQAGRHTGARIAREPSTMVWHELMTRDVEGAKAFYTQALGVGEQAVDDGVATYTMLTVEEQPVAGLMPMPGDVPADVPPYWTVYFDVEDTDAAVRIAADAGGTVVSGPQDSPYGRLAFLQDPQGAAFAVIHSEPPGE